jgi:hypothetical protein
MLTAVVAALQVLLGTPVEAVMLHLDTVLFPEPAM